MAHAILETKLDKNVYCHQENVSYGIDFSTNQNWVPTTKIVNHLR